MAANFLPLNHSFEANLGKSFCWLFGFLWPFEFAKMAKLVNLGNQALRAAKPHLETFWYYGKVELAPPKVTDIPAIIGGFSKLLGGIKSGAWKEVTVKQALLNSLVTAEVVCWFYIGECIGKRHFVGYKLS